MKIVFTLFLSLFSICLLGQTRKIVPDQFPTIQDSVDGDPILFKPHIYYGVVDFMGKEMVTS